MMQDSSGLSLINHMLYEMTAVPMFKVLLRGSKRVDLIRFSTFACLHSEMPKLRILRTEDDPLRLSDDGVRHTIRELTLSESDCAGQGQLTPGFGLWSPQYVYRSCEQFAALQGMPVAIIAFGKLHSKMFTALLVVPDAVPAPYVLQCFQGEI